MVTARPLWTIPTLMIVSASLGGGQTLAGQGGADTGAPRTTKERARVTFSHDLPPLRGDKLSVTVVEVNYGPGESSTPHSHPCPVIGYVLEGTLRTQVKGEPEANYKAGESFYEPPNGIHQLSANASDKEPTKLLAYFVCDQHTALSVAVPERKPTKRRVVMDGTLSAASKPVSNDVARYWNARTLERMGILYARIALGVAFLSGIADRFGLYWGRNVGYGDFAGFLRYTAKVNSFMPSATIPFLGWAATAAELFFGIALVVGIWPRWVAIGSAMLLVLFGIAMTISFGIKSPLDYSVFSASAAAVLLALYQSRKTGANS
jgi:putative oxidoreductase